VISGESGAVTTGLLVELMEKDTLKPLREKLQINKDSRILCISTEGDTDKENYRRILRDGYYPS
jgi:diaminopropionate ammonia-lyase